ncbi:hypothetical protein SAMN05428989_2107 [Pseudoxanthomonas sp. GM95]|uniref:glycosyltransferase family 39 protein n=1 Tax=Pseudoxanthomonas sp. GM95 TaxID=1881043 RepID=UPI0008B6720F|nr:hypothetical protein [Pseudoxanthomonas sp. GM95]SEL63152.1 hypothetical protein SAMN05428989_2107 [Pseudoxanthomonas sp. GM95]
MPPIRPEVPALRWPAWAFTAIALVACGCAFVGLGNSNYWADELFTVFVMGGDGGLAGLWQRALTDVHPPLYYALLHGWSLLGDLSEIWLRLPSAVCAVLALLVTARVLLRRFSPAALGYAIAVAAVSFFFFEQAQNARSYGLSLLISAALLGVTLWLREHAAASVRFPWKAVAALWLLGLAGSFVHFYLFLLTGMVMAWLLAVPRLRVAVIASGLSVLAAVALYTWLLLHATAQDVDKTWYRADFKFFWTQTRIGWKHLAAGASGWALTALCLVAVWRRWRDGRGSLAARVPEAGRAAAQLSLFVLVGLIGSGVLVSCVVAPSYSARNVLVALPFICALMAWLYDAAGPRLATRGSHVLAALLVIAVAANLWLQRGRLVQRNEPWRTTADFVARMPGCAGEPIPVMHPYKFGPPTADFRAFAQRQFFGHYAPPGMRIQAWMPSELVGRHPTPALQALLSSRAEQAGTGHCALLAWAVHDLDKKDAPLLAEDLARAPGIAPRRVVMQSFLRAKRRSMNWRPTEDGFVFYVIPARAVGTPAADPGPLVQMPAGTLGRRLVVGLQASGAVDDGRDHFATESWSNDGHLRSEAVTSAPRLACDPPMRANDGIRPSPTQPGCAPKKAPVISAN